MREDVVGDEERSWLDLVACQLEQALVLLLLGVEEHDVEHVVDRGQRLERVAGDELSPLLEARGISKSFGSVQALTDVDFVVRAGEVMTWFTCTP